MESGPTSKRQRVVLLTGAVEFSYLSQWLRDVNPEISVEHAVSRSDLDRLATPSCHDTTLVAFVTDIVVPAAALAAVGERAINIHPGSPAYPGSDAASWALYERATVFGVTAHRMIAKVDAGPIVASISFAISPDWSLNALNERAYHAAIALFHRLAPALADKASPLPANGESWTGPKRTCRDRQSLSDRLASLPLAERQRAIRAFGWDTIQGA